MPTLYYHPVSTTSRPIMMFAAEHGLAIDYRVVDLFGGEHLGSAFSAINPNQAVPVLQDGSFRLTESSAILKYLADCCESAAYPRELHQRARVNEAMDWFNTGLVREFAYGLMYPQLMPHYKREDPQAQAAALGWSQPRAARLLGLLDEWLLGPKRRFLLGERLTLADYFGLGVLTLGDVARQDYSRWPNIERWLATMKSRPSFVATHDIFYAQFVAPAAGRDFVVA